MRWHLVLLVVMTILPLLVLIAYRQFRDYEETRDSAGQRVLELTRTLSLAVDRELQVSIAALQALALSRPLQAGDFASFRVPLETLIAQQWPGANAIVTGRDGRELLDLALPAGAPLPARTKQPVAGAVFTTAQVAVSDLFDDPVTGRPTVAIDVPVRDRDGAVLYALTLQPDLRAFADLIRRQRLPDNWVISIFDRTGAIVARVPNGDRFVGGKASTSFLPYVLGGRERLVESTSLEGTPLLSAVARSQRFGWSAGIGLPQEEIIGPAVEVALRTFGIGALFIAASVLLAIFFAAQITRPIAVLRRLAASTSGDERLTPPPLFLREADEVAQALREAEEKRRQSDAEGQVTKAALRLSDAKLQQAQKLEAIGGLTGGMAHDFNNLLGVIIGSLDLALPKLTGTGKVKELVEEAIAAALKGAELTQSLLAFARQQPLQPVAVDPNELITNAAKMLTRTFESNITIALELAPDIWPVVVDRAQFETALLNLATNARDAMPNGGRLTIATKNVTVDADYAVPQAELVPGDYCLIEISDTGTGIKPEALARIFEPFYTTKEIGQGTGLGLSMVFGFMKQSGGHINVYSEYGNGTIFRLYLPRARGDAAETPVVPEAPGTGASETVLVVDDNPALLRVCVDQLKELGYDVLEAQNAEAALAMLDSRRVDLLFTDIMMPGEMNGLELTHYVRQHWPAIKIVVTSGFPKAMVDGRWKAMADSVRLLTKPYRKEELARALRDALAQ